MPRRLADEAARERELLLAEARRLDDDLIQRQLRYADRSWTPPAQGGERRADDEEAQAERARPGARADPDAGSCGSGTPS